MKTMSRNEKIKTVAAIIVLMLCEAFFFRNILGNDRLVGDRGDGRLTNLLAEHWWRFFQGKEKFSELLMFYPAQGVLGYTDLLLGHGLIYSVFRLIGMNLYAAYKFALIAMHSIGMVSMYYLLQKKLKISHIWAFFGTIAFCCSDTFARHMGHTQLLAVSMLPILLIFFIGFVQNFENRRKRNIYAYLCILWFALLTYTAWYIAFFTGMFCLVFLLVSVVRMTWVRFSVFKLLKNWMTVLRYDFLGYVLFLIIVYLPFIYVYLPVFQLSVGYSYDVVKEYLPELIDLINVTDTNYMMGWLMKLLKLEYRGYSVELTEGYSCVLLLLFFAVFFIQRKSKQNEKNNMEYNIIIDNIFVTVFACFALFIRVGSEGDSLWIFIYYLIPMARSIRAVSRFLLWLSFPIAIITSHCADRYMKNLVWKRPYIPFMIVILLFVSNINTNGVSSGWVESDELGFINSVSAPPEDAECFYIIDSKKLNDAAHINQLDAFEIGTIYSLKTINGYSGQYPKQWGGIWDIYANSYENSIYDWINMFNLTNVYAYDKAYDRWISYEDRISNSIADVFYPSENKFSLSSGLKDYNQGEFIWTGKNFKTNIKNDAIQEHGLVIKLATCLDLYMAQNKDLEPYIQLFIDGIYIQDLSVSNTYAEYLIPMDSHESDEYQVELKTNCYFNPKGIDFGEDSRDLSIALYYIGN